MIAELDVHLYSFGKRWNSSRYLISYNSNFAYCLKKLLWNVVDNFPWVLNCYIISKNKKIPPTLRRRLSNVMRLLTSRTAEQEIAFIFVFLHLKHCVLRTRTDRRKYFQIWLVEERYKWFDEIVYLMKDLYSQHERRWNGTKNNEII